MPDSIVALELAEIEALTDLYRAAPAGVVTDCGLSVKEIGDAVLIAASRFDVLALNRLVGLGLRSSPSDEAIAEATTVIEQTGSPRCFVPVAPTGASDSLGARLEQLGLRRYNKWMRLRRSLDDLPRRPESAATSLEVRRISVDGLRLSARAGAIISPTIDQTAEDTVTRDAPSFRNLRRLGFEGRVRAAQLSMGQDGGPAHHFVMIDQAL